MVQAAREEVGEELFFENDLETYFQMLHQSLLDGTYNMSPVQALLNNLDPQKVDVSSVRKFLSAVKNRGSIVIAFDKTICEKYIVGGRELEHNTGEELVIVAPDKKISIDTVLGFESMGEFEDGVLEEIGVEL